MSIVPPLSLFMLLMCISYGRSVKYSSVELAYKKGYEAYSEERWSECIAQFEESLHLYKLYKSVNIKCGVQCRSHQNSKSHITNNFQDLKIFEYFILSAHCLTNCKKKGYNDIHMHSYEPDSIISLMKDRAPYEYLHICYFHMYAFPKAASAAYTYLLVHQDDLTMKNNFKYYTELPEVDIDEVVDLESEDYEVMYKLGQKSYKKNNWGEAIVAMEEVITDYIGWEEECRIDAEHLVDQEWSPEFVITVSNNILFILQNKQKCQDKLEMLGFTSGINFLGNVLNYLQMSYYHMDKPEEAAKAVASYLTLLPDDEDMLHNKNIYDSFIDKNAFTERSDIAYYYKRDKYEKELLSHYQDNEIIFNTVIS